MYGERSEGGCKSNWLDATDMDGIDRNKNMTAVRGYRRQGHTVRYFLKR